jgi:hypothetical protein
VVPTRSYARDSAPDRAAAACPRPIEEWSDLIMSVPMHISSVAAACLAALLLASPAAAAQDAGAKGDKPKPSAEKPAVPAKAPAPAQTAPGKAAPDKAAAPGQTAAPGKAAAAGEKAEEATVLYVTGLTPDNTPATKKQLTLIQRAQFRCPGCDETSDTKSTCAKCKQDLVGEKVASLREIVVDPKAGSIGFELAPGQHILMSELQTALARQQLVLQTERFVLPRAATLYVGGVADEAAAGRLQAALETSGMFEHVVCRPGAAGKPAELHLRNKANAPTAARVTKLLTDTDAAFKVLDVEWSAGPGKS